jgi:hypothetical protein
MEGSIKSFLYCPSLTYCIMILLKNVYLFLFHLLQISIVNWNGIDWQKQSDYPYKWMVLRIQPIGHLWIIFYIYSICLMCLEFIGCQNFVSFHPCLCVIYINVSSLLLSNQCYKQTITTTDYVHDKWMNSKIRVYSTIFALHPCILSNYAHHLCCTLTAIRWTSTSKQSLMHVLGVTSGCFFTCIGFGYLKSIGWKFILEKSGL